ncbi:MAG: cellulase family glycosylhydrolase [Promethearchaeota archaeon]
MALSSVPSRLGISGRWFVDEEGRTVILRGVNLGGSTKVPFEPDGATHISGDWPPTDLENVTWVGRPFPRAEAEEHFTRLKAWGFNCLRFLTTWEAIEHAGPYEFDAPYLDYYAELVGMAGEYGFYVFVDPHQDVWSRVTGGDGAPLWLFDKLGLDYTKFDDAGLAVNMQALWSPDKGKNKYGKMVWGENYKYFTNGTMWTLFFGGRDFAPHLFLEDEGSGERVNVQDYMFRHYAASLEEIAKRVKDMPHVFGFDSLNEPHHGFIGHKARTRRLKMDRKNKTRDPPLPGLAWSPVDGMYAAAGNSFELEVIGIKLSSLGLGVKGKERVNPGRVSIWKEGARDFWRDEGVWDLGPDGEPVCPDDDYFRVVRGEEVDFTRDYLLPFAKRVADVVRKYNPGWVVVVEDEPEKVFTPGSSWPDNTPDNMVNGFHWYDLALNFTGRFLWPISVDGPRVRPVFGLRGVQKMYSRQIGRGLEMTRAVNGGNCPCLVGEFGCLMDLNKGRSYRKWARGKRGPGVFKWQVVALDLMYNAMDEHLLGSTQWNYTADNDNKFGDRWNLEDLSIFSRDQQDVDWKTDVNSGARALEGFCRPYARKIAGTPLEVRFERKRGKFRLVFEPNPSVDAPTEVYVPKVQYPGGFVVKCDGAEWHGTDDPQVFHVEKPVGSRVVLEVGRHP